jgi:hypothetical protein
MLSFWTIIYILLSGSVYTAVIVDPSSSCYHNVLCSFSVVVILLFVLWVITAFCAALRVSFYTFWSATGAEVTDVECCRYTHQRLITENDDSVVPQQPRSLPLIVVVLPRPTVVLSRSSVVPFSDPPAQQPLPT